MPSVEFWFDITCPYAYLAHTQIEALCAEHGATLQWKPMLLGGLFRTIGAGEGPMPTMPASKARLNDLDMRRWAAHWNVPFTVPAGHPNRSVTSLRCILASDDVPRAAKALYAAYWHRAGDISDDAVVRAALDEAGFDGAALLERAGDPALKRALRSATDTAAELGIFGAPTFIIRRDGDAPVMVWGQDRLHFVVEALSGRLTP